MTPREQDSLGNNRAYFRPGLLRVILWPNSSLPNRKEQRSLSLKRIWILSAPSLPYLQNPGENALEKDINRVTLSELQPLFMQQIGTLLTSYIYGCHRWMK
uniref:Uncharacterized protein n=1 Tax=Opuntia streptacantha TaxID=393608 RepID=A0A7C9CPY6_OPUST